MNRKEIEKLMADLPSQQPQETLNEKVIIGTMFIAFLVLLVMLPELSR